MAEQGTHDDLMRLGKIYARLFKIQAAGYVLKTEALSHALIDPLSRRKNRHGRAFPAPDSLVGDRMPTTSCTSPTGISACQLATAAHRHRKPERAFPWRSQGNNTWSSGWVAGSRVVIATTRTNFPVQFRLSELQRQPDEPCGNRSCPPTPPRRRCRGRARGPGSRRRFLLRLERVVIFVVEPGLWRPKAFSARLHSICAADASTS